MKEKKRYEFEIAGNNLVNWQNEIRQFHFYIIIMECLKIQEEKQSFHLELFRGFHFVLQKI